ncbi:MAG: maleylpyruvate isomerase family mycothiol-dependent enzyme [Acidobacteriota bacterium]
MEPAPATIAAAVADRHAELSELLDDLEELEIRAASGLAGWDRMTVLCHLRYGAEASLRVTEAALRGERAAFYPDGRTVERPWTLQPRPGEGPFDIVREFRRSAAALDAAWAAMGTTDWDVVAVEPDDNPDLGPMSLGALAVLRLTEVEVHGVDLDVGAADWSDAFIAAALPLRLRWLPDRRAHCEDGEHGATGSWSFRPDEGDPVTITVDADGARVDDGATGEVEFAGAPATLLGVLLGRRPLSDLRIEGDRSAAEAFANAFPSP